MTNTETKPKLPDLTPEEYERFLPTSIELHLRPSSDFTKKGWGKKVKAAGGSFSEARGHTSNRYVTLPLSEKRLIGDLLCLFPSYKKTTIVFRGGFGGWRPHAWVVVHEIPNITEVANDPVGAEVAKVEKALDKLKGYINGDQCRREIQRVLDNERKEAERKARQPLRDLISSLVNAESQLQKNPEAQKRIKAPNLFRSINEAKALYKETFGEEYTTGF